MEDVCPSPTEQHELLQQLQQLHLQTTGVRHDSSTASSHSSIPQQTHEVFKACFAYLHPVDVARVMASSKALSALSMQLLRTGQVRHAARQLLIAAVQGAAARSNSICSLDLNYQYSSSQYSQQQCAQAMTWLLKVAGPELVLTPAATNFTTNSSSSSSSRCSASATSGAAYHHGQSLCSQSDTASFTSRLLCIQDVPVAVTRQLAAAGLRVSYDQAVAAARHGVLGVHTWLVAQLQLGVSLDAIGVPPYFRDAAVLQRRLEQQQSAGQQVRPVQESSPQFVYDAAH
jgi:hypothetical protein